MSTIESSIASIADPVNVAILAVSEDRLAGFMEDPISEISLRSGVPVDLVIERLRAMLAAGTIRRIRQTLMATNLAAGALVAWEVPEERLSAAFDYMVERDPFSGHVVIRTTDSATAGFDVSPVDHAQDAAGILDREARTLTSRGRSARRAGG